MCVCVFVLLCVYILSKRITKRYRPIRQDDDDCFRVTPWCLLFMIVISYYIGHDTIYIYSHRPQLLYLLKLYKRNK